MMREVAFDESGNSGQNLLDPAQPVFTLASVARRETEVGDAVTALLHGGPFGELKFTSMRRSENGRAILSEIFASGLLEPGTARVVPVRKEWMVAGKMVDLLWEPGAANTNYFYASGLHRKLADMLFHQGPEEAGAETWAQWQRAFVAAVRHPHEEVRVGGFEAALAAVKEASAGKPIGIVFEAVPDETASLAELIPDGDDELDPALTGLIEQIDHWSRRLGEPFRVVHDNSAVVQRGRETVLRFSDQEIEPSSFDLGEIHFGLPEDSTWESIKHVKLIGYDALLDRLKKPGCSVQWSLADWDRFVQHLNLYRADEDTPENLVRKAGAAAIDAYTGLYGEAQRGMAPVASTAVVVDGAPAVRPDVAEMLAGGSTVLLRGTSGTGKTLWARSIAVELAAAGHLPIWIEADMCDGSFLTACAQAVAPYTALSVNELLKAADASGRAVAFIVDDFSKVSAEGRRRLLDGLRTARVRASGRGVLVTDQHVEHASQFGHHTDVELLLPDDEGRRAVLAAYDHAELIDRCEAFGTPLELSLAAQCANDLGSELTHAELFDTYVDKLALGDPVTRGGLRSIAARMTADLRPFQRRGDVTRHLRRELDMSDEQLRGVFDCDLLVAARGRISFRHEQFERFLAAEALLLGETDPGILSRRLNSPSATGLRTDVIALEGDRARLETLLSLCEDPDVLVSAANGQLGPAAAEVVGGVFADALNDACARTTGPGISLHVKSDLLSGCEWKVPTPASRTQGAQLSAIGRVLAEGTWIEGVDVLLRHTDELCARVVEKADPKVADALASQVFSETYVLALSGGLPATPLVQAAASRFGFGKDDPERVLAVVNHLLPEDEERGLSALWIAAQLLRDPGLPLRVDVITECVASTPYHLRAAGLHLAEDRSRRLTDEQRDAVVNQIEALSTSNLLLSSAQLEALGALGGVQPAKTEEDIAAEIEATLSMRGDPEADKLAYGIVSNQFENEIVGPYYEVVSGLPEEQQTQLLVMALNGCEYGWTTDAFILDEIKDLVVPEVCDAVSQYVARFNPDECMSPQFAMQAIMRAITLLTRAGLPVPEPSIGERDPAWHSAMELISAAAGKDDEVLADGWERFATEHPNAVASFVGKLKGVRRMNEAGALLDRLESTMPPAAIDALVDALEHPARIRSVGGRDIDLRGDIVAMLTEVGDRRAAETLRRFTDDPKIGRAATEAVRAIEARIS